MPARKANRFKEDGGSSNVNINHNNGGKGGAGTGYEELREKRMRENKERMEKLGILELSLNLNKSHTKKTTLKALSSLPKKDFLPALPARRSSRLKSLTPVNYVEVFTKTKRGSSKTVEIKLREGSQPEVYTVEHEKLLGDCKTAWELFVDGCGDDGKRIYDQEKGETCHQCRQKTLGLHTHCSKCNLVQGQFCGDCLYMRYGENVMEVNQNSNWICPVCRGICNCSFCRKAKGWAPTGNLYRKVTKLGYKSVAHYLIQTLHSQTVSEDLYAESLVSEDREVASTDKGSESSTHNESLNVDKHPMREMRDEEKQAHDYVTSIHVEVDDGYADDDSINIVSDDDDLTDEKEK